MSAEPSMTHELLHDEFTQQVAIITAVWFGLIALGTIIMLVVGPELMLRGAETPINAPEQP